MIDLGGWWLDGGAIPKWWNDNAADGTNQMAITTVGVNIYYFWFWA